MINSRYRRSWSCVDRRSDTGRYRLTASAVRAGIPRVVMAWREPSLFVADCQGYELLTSAGRQVASLLPLHTMITVAAGNSYADTEYIGVRPMPRRAG
jgi:hypothetical protein